MKQCNVAILGATGAVGREMLKVLGEYEIPVGELRLLASARSAGEKVMFGDREVVIQIEYFNAEKDEVFTYAVLLAEANGIG